MMGALLSFLSQILRKCRGDNLVKELNPQMQQKPGEDHSMGLDVYRTPQGGKADAVILILGKMVQRSSRRGCTEGCHQPHIRRMQSQKTRGGPGSAAHCPMPSFDNGTSRDFSVRFWFVCFLQLFRQEDKRHLVAGYFITL